jgi:hypothetical protein
LAAGSSRARFGLVYLNSGELINGAKVLRFKLGIVVKNLPL